MALSQMQTASIISQGTVTGKGTSADQPKLGRGVAGPLTKHCHHIPVSDSDL